MSTLPFLPPILATIPTLQFDPPTYSQLVEETLGGTLTDADGVPLAIGNLVAAQAAFEADLPNMDLDLAGIPTGTEELDPSAVAGTLPILDSADASVAALTGVPGLVDDAALDASSGRVGNGGPVDDCTTHPNDFDAVIDFGTFVVPWVNETVTIPSGAGLHPRGRNYVWSYNIEFGDPEVWTVLLDPPNTFAHPPRIAYLIASPVKVGVFIFKMTIWFIDDTRGYKICAKFTGVRSLPPPPPPPSELAHDFGPNCQGVSVGQPLTNWLGISPIPQEWGGIAVWEQTGGDLTEWGIAVFEDDITFPHDNNAEITCFSRNLGPDSATFHVKWENNPTDYYFTATINVVDRTDPNCQ